MARPLIGVSGPDRGGMAAWWFTWLALFIQGARAKHITPRKTYPVEELDGIVVGGGADINPEHYGMEDELKEVEKAFKQTVEKHWLQWLIYPFIYLVRRLFSKKKDLQYDKQRDQIELSLLQSAIQKGIPVLGICRGAQLMNISLGGTLLSDIQEFYEEEPLPRSIFPVKQIQIEPETLLKDKLQVESCTVNALHHQAIRDLGEGIKVGARESNGIIQAIECDDLEFFLGVQWHPEYLPLDRIQRRLFLSLVQAAARYRNRPADGKAEIDLKS